MTTSTTPTAPPSKLRRGPAEAASTPSADEARAFADALVCGVPANQEGGPAEIAEFLVRWNVSIPLKTSRRVETLMLRGEPGTGKTRFARLMSLHRAWCSAPPSLRREAENVVHAARIRRHDPLNALRCAVGDKLDAIYGWKEQPLPNFVGTLFDSLLFGYAKGAFSDAKEDTPGALTWPRRQPERKDVFLDEVTEIDSGLQAKLLGVLSTGQFTPVGGKEPYDLVDRLIFASNRDLKTIVGDRFRRDLYERIATPCIRIGGISEYKPNDFAVLVRGLVARISTDLGVEPDLIHLEDSEVQELYDHSWPGNVRQLEKFLEDFVRACLAGRTGRRPLEVAAEIAPLFETTNKEPSHGSDVERVAREFCTQEFERVLKTPEPTLTPTVLVKRFVDSHRLRKVFQEVYKNFNWPRDGHSVNHNEWQKNRDSRGRTKPPERGSRAASVALRRLKSQRKSMRTS